MTNKECLQTMFELQQQLNDETNGIGWEKGYTKTNNIINWRRCIYMECAELVDSFNWKHWKNLNIEIDWENARVEIVDIWHFIMSLVLEHYSNNKLGKIHNAVEDIINTKGFKEFCSDAYTTDKVDSFEIINDIETIIHKTTKKGYHEFDAMLIEYFSLALKCGINLQSLYTYYIAKNVLNRFRQDHGYKDGSYIKIWGGREDNIVMLELMNNGLLDIELIYEELEKEYKRANGL